MLRLTRTMPHSRVHEQYTMKLIGRPRSLPNSTRSIWHT